MILKILFLFFLFPIKGFSQEALYKDIANATGGEVVVIKKENIKSEKSMALLSRMIEKEKDFIPILMAPEVRVESGKFDFYIDSSVTEFVVIYSGLNSRPLIHLFNPKGEEAKESESFPSTKGNRLAFTQPSVGKWSLDYKIGPQENASFMIKAKSPWEIYQVEVLRSEIGREGPSMFPYNGPLTAGKNEFFEITTSIKKLKNAEFKFISFDNTILESSTGKRHPEETKTWLVESKVPLIPFRIFLDGTLEDGERIQRTYTPSFETGKRELISFKSPGIVATTENCKILNKLGVFIANDLKNITSGFASCLEKDSKLSSSLSFNVAILSDYTFPRTILHTSKSQKLKKNDCEEISLELDRYPKKLEKLEKNIFLEWEFHCVESGENFMGQITISVSKRTEAP